MAFKIARHSCALIKIDTDILLKNRWHNFSDISYSSNFLSTFITVSPKNIPMMTSYMRIFHFGLIQFNDEPHICTILECKPTCSYHSHIWYASTWFTLHILCLSIRTFQVFAFDLSCLFYLSFFFQLCVFFCWFGNFFCKQTATNVYNRKNAKKICIFQMNKKDDWRFLSLLLPC